MKNTFDLKSATIGLLLGIIVILGAGAAASKSTHVGRFQIGGTTSHAVILDTATGKAWRCYLPPNGGSTDSIFWKEKPLQ